MPFFQGLYAFTEHFYLLDEHRPHVLSSGMKKTTTHSPAILKRSITYPLLCLYGLGTILGAGIYVLIGKVAGSAGLYAPVAFLLAAILASFSGYSYAALSSRYPKSAGEVNYVHIAFNLRPLSILVGILVVLTGIVSAATLVNGFVGYLHIFIDASAFWTMSALILTICLLAIWGVSQSVFVAAIITLIEVGGLLWVILTTGSELHKLPEYLPELLPLLEGVGAWSGVFMGSFIAFYAFIGFEDMVNMSEETQQPEKNMPRAIITVLFVSAFIYILIAVLAVLALPLSVLEQSHAPMADIMSLHGHQAYTGISLISLIAIINGALVQIIMGSRVLYGMGYLQLAPVWLGQVHRNLKTPVSATMLVGLITWLLAVNFSLTALAEFTSLVVIAVFLLVNISLLFILRQEKVLPANAMRISAWIPWIAVVLNSLFLLFRLSLFVND